MPSASDPAADTAADTKASAAADKKADSGQVSVIATGSFHEFPDFSGKLFQAGDTFETDRDRAVELRASGLIKYADEKAEKEAGGDDPEPSTDNGQVSITSRSFKRVKRT